MSLISIIVLILAYKIIWKWKYYTNYDFIIVPSTSALFLFAVSCYCINILFINIINNVLKMLFHYVSMYHIFVWSTLEWKFAKNCLKNFVLLHCVKCNNSFVIALNICICHCWTAKLRTCDWLHKTVNKNKCPGLSDFKMELLCYNMRSK